MPTPFDRARLAAAARPRDKYIPPDGLISLLCRRCDRIFKTSTMSRECFPCQKAAARVYGSLHPMMEAAGC